MSQRYDIKTMDGSDIQYRPDVCRECGRGKGTGTLTITHPDGKVETITGEPAATLYDTIRVRFTRSGI